LEVYQVPFQKYGFKSYVLVSDISDLELADLGKNIRIAKRWNTWLLIDKQPGLFVPQHWVNFAYKRKHPE